MNLPQKWEWHPTWLEKILLGIALVCMVAWWFIDQSFWFFFGMLFAVGGLRVLDKEHKRLKDLEEAYEYHPDEPLYGASEFVDDEQLRGSHL